MISMKSNLRRILSFHCSSTFSSLNQFTNELNLNPISDLRRNFSIDTSSSSSIQLKQLRGNFYARLLKIPNATGSVLPFLNKWVEDGNTVDQNDVRSIIRQFRKSRRFNHCLEISEWMSMIKHLEFSEGDAAVRLDLTSKVHGLKKAESYFDTIPEESRRGHVYTALLNCYTRALQLDKAESTMQKMQESGYAGPLAYSNMLKLYSQLRKQEKIKSLSQEMDNKGISFDGLSYSAQLQTYSASLDISRLERLLLQMEEDSTCNLDWDTYAVAANVYLKARATEKAKLAVEKSEQLIGGRFTTNGYEFLITIYAKMGSKNDIFRLWDIRKRAGKLHYSSYSSVITSLIKLNDLESAEKFLEEWQVENSTTFDIRFATCLVKTYCGTGYTEKAESFVEKLIESGYIPSASTWKHIILGYRKCKRMEKAINAIGKAICGGSPWKPDLVPVADCLEYLEGKGDVNGAEVFVKMLRTKSRLSMKVRERLEKYDKEKKV